MSFNRSLYRVMFRESGRWAATPAVRSFITRLWYETFIKDVQKRQLTR